MANILASDVHPLTILKATPAEAITEFPREDDWEGWLDLLDRRDTGTIHCVPACMRPSIMQDIGPDGRLLSDNMVPGTPFGVAKFLILGRRLPWSGSGMTPDTIHALLARGYDLEIIKKVAEESRREAQADHVMRPPRQRQPLPPVVEPEGVEEPAREPACLSSFSDLYFIRSGDGPIKIGVSVDPKKRLKGLQTAHPFKLELLCVVSGAGRKESEYHQRFAEFRLEGEWFSPAPEILSEISRLSTQGEGV